MSAREAPAAGLRGDRGSIRTARRVVLAPRPPEDYWSSTILVSDDRVTLTLIGEIDIACEAALVALLERMEAVPHLLVVDLAAVTFADSYALRTLFDSARHRRDVRLPALLLSGPGPLLARVLCALGAQRVVDTEHHEQRGQAGQAAAWYAC